MIFSILRDGFCSFSLFAWFRVDMTNWLKSQLKPIRQTVNAKYKYNICTPICEFIKDHLYQVTNQWRFYLMFTTFWETGSMRTFVRQTSITQRSLLPLAHRMIIQWWIQDFPDGGGGTNPQSDIASLPHYLANFTTTTAWKWKKLDQEEEGARAYDTSRARQRDLKCCWIFYS